MFRAELDSPVAGPPAAGPAAGWIPLLVPREGSDTPVVGLGNPAVAWTGALAVTLRFRGGLDRFVAPPWIIWAKRSFVAEGDLGTPGLCA
jgi:hypothetical protein